MYKSKFKLYSFLLIYCTLCLQDSSAADPNETVECILKSGNDEFDSRSLGQITDESTDGQNLLDDNIIAGKDIKTITIYVSPNNQGKSNYVKESLEKNRTFQLRLTKDFDDYENNESSPEMKIGVILDCGLKYKKLVTYTLTIEDKNNHPPTFLEKLYEFELPIPFPKDMNLAPFGKGKVLTNIVAKDVDLTNSEVSFKFLKKNNKSIEEDWFSIDWNKQKDGKLYTAVLKSKNDLYFDKEINLIVQATDNGKSPKTTGENETAKIVIKPIKAAPALNFSSDLYTTTCKECKSSDSNVIIPFKPEIQLLNLGSQQAKISVHPINEGLKDAFEAKIKNSTVQLSLKLPADFKDDYIFVTVKATLESAETKTLAHIVMPKSQPVIEESSNGGLIAATVILSILLIGLLIGAAYYYNKLRNGFSSSLMT